MDSRSAFCVFRSSNLRNSLVSAIKEQSETDEFTDITIEVEGKVFRSHRFLLSACSGFFQGLLKSGMKEAKEQHISLKNMSKETFEVVLQSLYQSSDFLDSDNVYDVWHAANILQITQLIVNCKDFLSKNLDCSNCFDIYKNAKILDTFDACQKDKSEELNQFYRYIRNIEKEDLASKAILFIHNNFTKLKGSVHLLDFSYDEILEIVSNEELCIKSEDEVLDLILDWTSSEVSCQDESISCDESEVSSNQCLCHPRSEYLVPLLDTCRLLTLNNSSLKVMLNKTCIVHHVEDAKLMLAKCIHFQLRGNDMYNASSKWSIRRKKDHMQNVIFWFEPDNDVFKGITSLKCLLYSQNGLNNISSADWTKAIELHKFNGGKVVSAVVHNDMLFALELNNDNTYVTLQCASLLSNSLKNKFKTVMLRKHENLSGIGMVVVDDKLYFVSSSKGSSRNPEVVVIGSGHVHVINLFKCVNVCGFKVSSFESTIVAVGVLSVITLYGLPSLHIECYDTISKEVYILDPCINPAPFPLTLESFSFFKTLSQTFLIMGKGLWSFSKQSSTSKLKFVFEKDMFEKSVNLYGSMAFNGDLLMLLPGAATDKPFHAKYNFDFDDKFEFDKELVIGLTNKGHTFLSALLPNNKHFQFVVL